MRDAVLVVQTIEEADDAEQAFYLDGAVIRAEIQARQRRANGDSVGSAVDEQRRLLSSVGSCGGGEDVL